MSRIEEIQARATDGLEDYVKRYDGDALRAYGAYISKSDRDTHFLLDEISRLTARVEALERAICNRCEFCVIDCAKPGECTGWQFDYERFAGGERE